MTAASQDSYLYTKRWRQERAQGVLRLVDATGARLHISTLVGAGWSARSIAGEAGIAVNSVVRILDGHERANRRTVAAILDVDPNTIASRASKNTTEPFVPRIGSTRRIQALLAMGWPHQELRSRTGVRTAALLSQQGRWVTRGTHNRIARAYDELAMTTGPSNRTRARARKLGYAMPLQWDDIDFDQTPVQESDPAKGTSAARVAMIEDIAFMAEHGVGATEAAKRVGMSVETLDKYLRRGGVDEVLLLNRLTSQDPISLTGSKKRWTA